MSQPRGFSGLVHRAMFDQVRLELEVARTEVERLRTALARIHNSNDALMSIRDLRMIARAALAPKEGK